MRARKTRRQNLLRSLLTLAVAGPLAASSLFVADVEADQAALFNPYRPHSPVVQSVDQTELFDIETEFEDSPSDGTDAGFWDGSAMDALAVEAIVAQDESGFCQSPLRESSEFGSSVFLPPTTGWFVQSGRRYMFVPANPKAVTIVRANQRANCKPENKFRTVSAIDNLRSSAGTAVELVPLNPLRNRSQVAKRFTLSLLETHSPTVTESISVTKLVVTDNLVFQRAMRQVQANESDLQWIVSGEVSRFNDEMQLDIRSARLSN